MAGVHHLQCLEAIFLLCGRHSPRMQAAWLGDCGCLSRHRRRALSCRREAVCVVAWGRPTASEGGTVVDGQDLEQLRLAYLQEVVEAVHIYVGTRGELRLESDRDADELRLTFTLTESCLP